MPMYGTLEVSLQPLFLYIFARKMRNMITLITETCANIHEETVYEARVCTNRMSLKVKALNLDVLVKLYRDGDFMLFQ